MSDARSRIVTVALREFKYTAMTKAFIFGAVVFPLVVWAAFPVIIMLTEQKNPPLVGTIAVIDPTGQVGESVRAEFERLRGREPGQAIAKLREEVARNPAAAIENPPVGAEALAAFDDDVEVDVRIDVLPGDADVDSAKERVRVGDLLALAEIGPGAVDVDRIRRAVGDGEPDPDDTAGVTLYTATEMHPGHTRLIRRRLGDAVVRVRAQTLGDDLETLRAILDRPRVATRSLASDGAETAEQADFKEMLPLFFAVLLAVTTFTSGQYLLTTTIEEKSNKVMEVLLSAVSPMQLMTGKILGQWLVSLVMLVMYGGLLLTALVVFAAGDLVGWTDLLCFGAYFVMSYFFTASAMAAIGSAVSDIHDAQSLMMPAMFVLLMAPMLLMIPASQNPAGLLATVSGFIPPLIPYIMIVRVTAGEVPPWQIALSMVIGFGSAAGGLWLAAKIFRVGVLMYGKPPSPLQMLKWVRYS